MQIDGRSTDIGQQIPSGVAGSVASRQRSGTSDPSGIASSKKAPQEVKLPGGGAPKEAQKEAVDLSETLEKLNDLVKDQQRDVAFSVDKRANTTVIKFFKKKTGELIKQFPPEEILAMKAKLRESTGLLLDTKA